MKYLILIFILAACTSREVLPQNPLIKQILKVRVGHEGLTNSFCREYKGDECLDLKIVTYELTNEFRKLLNDLNFRCRIGQKRFKVCLDKVGFCRHWYEKKGWFSKPVLHEEFIALMPLEFHVSANTQCRASDGFNF